MASYLYGCRVHGEAPTAITTARRRCARALGKHWSGKCLHTYLALADVDPATAILRGAMDT
eukprot:8214245-Pyramimonas_sp.AAC.1